MQRVTFGLVCLSFLCLSVAARAQDASSPIPETAAGAVQDFSGGGILDTGGLLGGTYVDVRHVIGDGVGYRNSYSQIGGFLPIWMTEDSLIAPNARFILTNSTQTGVNVGLVGRQYLEQYDRLIGMYGYYDNDQNYRNFRYQQFTVGAETLGTWWDLRGNGYFINGNQSNFVSAISLTGDPYYVGHLLAIQGRQLRDQALGGVDVELGVPLSPQTPWLRGYGGAYGYRHDGGNTVGYRGRLEANVANDLSLGMMVTYDAIFGTNINGTIEFKFSGFKPTVYFPQMTTRQRMTSSVQRNWRIATRSYVDTIDVATIDPSTHTPYFITHVSAGAAPGGDGTFEHPFGALPGSAPGQIVLVHNGTSSAAAPTLGNIALSDNQRLLGDGYPSLVYLQASYGGSNISGNYQLPGTSSAYQYPFVGGSPGNIVTLANNNEVAGLWFVNAGGSAITNTAAGSQNFNLHNINVQNSGQYGINLQNARGLGNISYVNADQFLNFNGGIGDNKTGGIQIATGAGGLDLHMSDVYMNATTNTDQAFGTRLTANAGDLNVYMNNVFANNNMSGIQLIENGRNLNALMNINPSGTYNLNTTVTANFNQDAGFDIQGNGGAINIRSSTLEALSNTSDNVRITTNNTNLVMGVANSFFSGSVLGSGVVLNQNDGVGNLTLVNIESNGNHENGVGVFSSNGGLTNTFVFNSTVVNNNNDAFHAEATTGANISFIVDPTNGSANANNGFFFKATGLGSFINANLASVNLDYNGNNAIHGEALNSAGVALFTNDVSGQHSGGDGFFLNAANGSSALAYMTNGSFNDSGVNSAGKAAMNINLDHSVMLMYTDNVTGQQTLAGTQDFGLKLNVNNFGLFEGTIRNGNFSDTHTDAVNLNVAGASAAQLQLAGTNNDRSVRDGLHATVNGAGSQAYLSMVDAAFGSGIRQTTFDNNGHNGLSFNVATGYIGVTSQNASFSNNGQSHVDGSGILGQLSGGGFGQLILANTTIDDNFDNGVGVRAVGGSTVFAQFIGGSVSRNGILPNPNLTARGNNGIALVLNGSTNNVLGMSNGTNVSGNGNDGLLVLAQNNSSLSGFIDGAIFTNNGATPDVGSPLYTGAGIDVFNRTNSIVMMNLNDVTSGNTGGNTTQQTGLRAITRTAAQTFIGATNVSMTNNVTGFLADTNGAGLLIAGFNGGDLSNNTADAVNNDVTGAGSIANINFDGTVGNGSGNIGALFNTTGGALLNVNAYHGTSFSNSGGVGLFSNVDGLNSQANFGLTNIQMLNNGASGFGGQGLLGIVTNGANMNAAIFNSSISADSLQGMELIVDGTGSVANFHVEGTVIDSNSSEGLLILATNSADVNYRSVNSSYNTNGSNGSLDGVKISADNSKVLSLFSGGSIDGNAGNGMNLSATNGAYMTTSLNNISISNNGLWGIQSAASGLTTTFNLLMSGTNPMSGNGLGNFSPFSFSNMNQAVIALTGSSNNSAGDGFSASFNNVTNAGFALVGPGTADNNAGRGVNVSMTNVTNGSVFVDKMTSISNNGLEGILVNMNTVANGSVNLNGPTQLSGNGSGGTSINIVNSTMVNNNPLGTAPVEILTLVDDLATPPFPLSNQLPKPVLATLTGLGYVPTTALTEQGMIVANSGGPGISVNLLNSTVQTDVSGHSILLQGNSATNSTGDGILLTVNNSSAIGAQLLGNQAMNNTANGMNIVGSNNAQLQNMVVDNGSILVNTALDFTIVGDTFGAGTGKFNLINTSATSVEYVTGFTLNTATSVGNVVFNTETGAFTPFTPFNNTDVSTGLTTVNGTPVPPYPNNLVPDFSQFLSLVFNNFAPGKNFAWDNDFDFLPGVDSAVYGSDLIGSQITVNFTNGLSLNGTLSALPGNPQGSHFVATSGNIGTSNFSNNAQDGIRFSLNNTNMDNLSVKNATITGNGTGGSGHGIEFTGSGGAVAASTLDHIVLDTNTITSNNGDGVRLVSPATTNTTINLTSTNNVIGQNAGSGVNLNLVANAQNLLAPFSGNTINGNLGGSGVNIQMGTNASVLAGSNFTNNTITANNGQGVNFAMGLGGSVTGNFTGNTINQNVKEGVRYAMGANNGVNLANVTANYSGNTINQNGAQGLNFLMGPVVPVAGQQYGTLRADFTGNTINQNTVEGIKITLDQGTLAGQGADFIGNNFYGNTISNNGSLGVRLTSNDNGSFVWNWNSTGSDKPANVISNNVNAGVGIKMNGNSTGTLNVVNTTFSNNKVGADLNFGGEGLNVTQAGSSVLSGSVTSSRFTGNAGDGALFSVTGNNSGTFAILQNFTIGGATADLGNQFTGNGVNLTGNNAGNGLEFLRSADGEILNINIQNNILNSNSQNGLLITAANKNTTDSYTMINNDMSLNTLDGLRLFEKADAHILANISLSTFTNNGGNGIHTLEQVNNASDLRRISGTWQQNVITGNAANGIFLDGASSGLLVGHLTNTSFGNLIQDNAGSGILVTGPGSLTIGSNMILENGTLADLGTENEDAGVLINVRPTSNITVTNNLIANNFGDGIQYGMSTGFSGTGATNTINITNNIGIINNRGRGIDLINRANTTTLADISGNIISGNSLEGVYIVNTADEDQNQFASSTVAMAATGSVLNSDPSLQLHMIQNQITGNGIGSGLVGTGLVIRVGTSNGLSSASDNGGFASTGVSGATIGAGASAATFFANVSSTRGGVVAQIDNNILGGNFGNDVQFNSFVSTVPPVTAGSWVAPPTIPTQVINQYESDPLSRFDLYFRGNTYDPGAVDSLGADYLGYASRDPNFVAFYNNAEGTFKSRLDTATNPGPFNSATRARNATRQGVLAVVPADGSNTFNVNYSGLGASTWRASLNSDPVLTGQGPFGLAPIGNNGELSYQWGSF